MGIVNENVRFITPHFAMPPGQISRPGLAFGTPMPDAIARGCRTPSRDRLPDEPPSGHSRLAGAHIRTALNTTTASRPARSVPVPLSVLPRTSLEVRHCWTVATTAPSDRASRSPKPDTQVPDASECT